MKRQQDREGSPRGSKRSRSYGPPDHDMGRERMSPDFDRRGGGGHKFMGGGGPREPFRDYDEGMDRGRKNFRDDRMPPEPGFMPPGRGGGGGGGGGPENDYRSLCITSIPSKLSDAELKDNLMHEFWKFGEMNVKVTFNGEQRIAYVNFKYPEDARAAMHKGRNDMFDRPIRIDPVYNKRRSGSPGDFSNRDHFAFHNRRNSPPPGYQGGPPGPPGPPMQRGPPGRHGPPMGGDRGPPFPPDRADGPPMFNSPPPANNDNEGSIGRKEGGKFPYHLDHIDPEYDEKATRTLFIGNLDVNISDIDLKRIFEKYGFVEDIDIKRPQKGQGNAYAFLKFINLDCAHRAKVEMSGKYIGKFQCKIGYGKVTPTTCLWVGGIGPWVSRETLEQEFDRFGAIQRIEWPSGKSFSYVLYDSIDAAKAACQEMRGSPALGGPDRRLRVDFADISHVNNPMTFSAPPVRPFPGPGPGPGPERPEFDRNPPPWRSPGNGNMDRGPPPRRDEWHGNGEPPFRPPDQRRGDFRPDMERGRSRDNWGEYPDDDRRRRPRSPGDYGPGPGGFPRRSRSPPDRRDFHMDRRDDMRGRDMGDRDGRRDDKMRGSPGMDAMDIRSLNDLAKSLPVAWNGALILKNSAFAARMHVVSGDVTIVDSLMRDPTTTEPPVLRITQRLRLDQPKLEDVGRRIANAGPHGHCILLAMPSTVHSYDEHMGVAQQRPLKNLVNYLKQKDAAGVISLPPNPNSNKNVGVLHAFPPCQFGYSFLLQRSPKLPPDFSAVKEEYLTVVVVVGAN